MTKTEPYTDPRCGCTEDMALHAVTCAYWPLAVSAGPDPLVDVLRRVERKRASEDSP